MVSVVKIENGTFPSKVGKVIIFCEANIGNIFPGKGTFRRVYAINAPIFFATEEVIQN